MWKVKLKLGQMVGRDILNQLFKNYQHLRQVQGSPSKSASACTTYPSCFETENLLNGTHHGVDPKYLQKLFG